MPNLQLSPADVENVIAYLENPTNGKSAEDREYYVMQGEIYTTQAFGSTEELSFSADKRYAFSLA